MTVDEHAGGPAKGDPLEPYPILRGTRDDTALSDYLFKYVWRKARPGWWVLFLFSLSLVALFIGAACVTIFVGLGSWGVNIPVAWGIAITQFVWWIGIGHAGTLISAILLLLQQQWRTAINRFAEAMTLFAVICAGLFPILHVGRPWFLYWLVPYPSTMQVWPQFRAALVWDVFAVSTYFTVSLIFWFTGLIPDLASLRDESPKRRQRLVYGFFALGWRGSLRQWKHWRVAYILLAGLSTPLVLSVHTVVSFDFAITLVPGYHSTIFPPYFVAGAVFSGFAMVMTWMLPARKYLDLYDVITPKHLENMNKVMLVTGLMVAYGYMCEHFMAWYGANPYEYAQYMDRLTGTYAPIYWLMLFCNVLVPQVFWTKLGRTSVPVMWCACILINVGMYCERFIIVINSLHRGFLPSKWGNYYPTWVDISLYVGSLGIFAALFLLFLRFIPAVPASEIKEQRAEETHEPLGTGAPSPLGA
jgi:molybdopterin-containing oxidoreductase family membrane subunit